MDSVSKQIVQDVDSGKYFAEAREWYNDIFIKPVYETATMYIYAVSSFILCAIFAFNLYGIFPSKEKVTIVAKLSDTLTHYPKLREIKSDTKEEIIKYMASNYIKSRESYNAKQFKDHYIFVYRNSSRQVFNLYQKNVSPNDTNSPLVTYGWEGKIDVDIKDIKLGDKNNLTVRFTKKGYDKYNRTVFVQNLESNIDYKLGKYKMNRKKKVPIPFSVENYQVKLINLNQNEAKK
ncbi:MAG: VirB8/TrbF family protein [Rickettsiales bacterium]